ncbi:LamG-like jellyroll fold domain-containing protein [Olivibacter sp. XZL3]|uniref:LamG-like jellyroll fold domain-containing protein n=1 Tax=Olivibacter sp. XZL3 TaxID=1735116 RepID=UPI0010663CC7|nr:LamG-like jellyroll fold domain-containing protein [Olivibacter sp. XZL3]
MKIFSYPSSFMLSFILWGLLLSSCDRSESITPNINLDQGLVYYFPFSGNSVDQVSQTSFDTHGASFENDRHGNPQSALCLTNNYMELNAGFSDAVGSLSFWVKVRDFEETGMLFNNTYQYINFGEYQLAIAPTGEIVTWCSYKWGYARDDEGYLDYSALRTKPVIQPNEWYHVVVRWSDENEQIEIFVNNKKILTESYIPDWRPWDGDDDYNVTAMGMAWRNPGSHEDIILWHFHGQFDEIRRYNRWIVDEEIAELYK